MSTPDDRDESKINRAIEEKAGISRGDHFAHVFIPDLVIVEGFRDSDDEAFMRCSDGSGGWTELTEANGWFRVDDADVESYRRVCATQMRIMRDLATKVSNRILEAVEAEAGTAKPKIIVRTSEVVSE